MYMSHKYTSTSGTFYIYSNNLPDNSFMYDHNNGLPQRSVGNKTNQNRAV